VYLFELFGSEADPRYQSLAISNADRQFGFLEAVIDSAIQSNHHFLSHSILRALNFHAIACLHVQAGEYRQCEVQVRDAEGAVVMSGVPHFRVNAAMDQLINEVNSSWNSMDPILLSSLVLWSICRIHPFINGNGRTARAACYYVLCVRAGGRLPGTKFLPSLLKDSPDYTPALRAVDASRSSGAMDMSPVYSLIKDLLMVQLASAEPPPEGGAQRDQ